jgi:hypothetical protein
MDVLNRAKSAKNARKVSGKILKRRRSAKSAQDGGQMTRQKVAQTDGDAKILA